MKLLIKYLVGVLVIFLLFPKLIDEQYNWSLFGFSLIMALGIPIAELLIKRKV